MIAAAKAHERMLDAALRYARAGFAVFPLWPPVVYVAGNTCSCNRTIRCTSPAKHPMGTLVPNGLTDASTDEQRIKHWWACRPDANIGLATGSVVVLDVDPRKSGNATLAELERQHGALPPALRVKTGSGGEHVYFAARCGVEIRNSESKLGPGLDVRGTGGYVVAPPSRHVSGGLYRWDCSSARAAAPLPDWLVTALQEPQQKTAAPAGTWREIAGKGVAEGQRNITAARLTGYLLRRYVDPPVVCDLMLAWNAMHCAPPLEKDELVKIVNSISGRELKRRVGT